MIVYLHSDGAIAAPSHMMHVAPAADIAPIDGEMPSEWKDETGKPLTIPVEFKFGRAEVPDNLGDYLAERGYARRTALILPPRIAMGF